MNTSYKILIFSLFFLSCEPKIIEVNSSEQLNIEIFNVQNESFYWDKNEEQIKYYRNGYIEVDYIKKDDKLIRRTYSESGLETEIEIIQKYGMDTFWQINPITLDDEQIVIRGVSDIYVGFYNKYRTYRFGTYYWDEADITTQKAYWENGNLRTQYINENQKIIRQDFDLDGLTLERATIVKQVYSIDTTWQINAITLEDKMIIQKGYVDSFIKQIFFVEPIIKIKGQYLDNKKHGSWYYYDKDIVAEVIYENNIIKNNYNEYILTKESVLKLQLEGYFINKKFEDTTFFESGYHSYTNNIILKDSLWKKYDLNGKLQQQVYYNTDSIH